MFKGINSIDFSNYFSSNEICLEYIAKIKWPDSSFTCKKCGHNNYCKGKINITEDAQSVNMMNLQQLKQCLKELILI